MVTMWHILKAELLTRFSLAMLTFPLEFNFPLFSSPLTALNGLVWLYHTGTLPDAAEWSWIGPSIPCWSPVNHILCGQNFH
jgi:hypothetical protein